MYNILPDDGSYPKIKLSEIVQVIRKIMIQVFYQMI